MYFVLEMTERFIGQIMNKELEEVIIRPRQLVAIHAFVFRSMILSLPTIVIAFQYSNEFCGQIGKVDGTIDITLSQWLFWINVVELIRSYLLILVLIDNSHTMFVSIFDVFSYPLKMGLFFGGFIIVTVTTETCFSEAFILWITSFINLLSILGDVASMKIQKNNRDNNF